MLERDLPLYFMFVMILIIMFLFVYVSGYTSGQLALQPTITAIINLCK